MLLTGADSVEEAAELLKRTGVGNVIIKCGKRGCYIRTDVEKYWIQAEQNVNCIDTTGAGDSFAAGFLNALLDGKSVDECAKEGNQCGAKLILRTAGKKFGIMYMTILKIAIRCGYRRRRYGIFS